MDVKNTKKILEFLTELNKLKTAKEGEEANIFNDIAMIVSKYEPLPEPLSVSAVPASAVLVPEIHNFQSKIYDDKDIFGKYDLWKKENARQFITIDPTIIQIMIFDDDTTIPDDTTILDDTTIPADITIPDDIVYSLKLIIRNKNLLTLRYTTQLFPSKSNILKELEATPPRTSQANTLTPFNAYNRSLDKYFESRYDDQINNF